MSQSRNESAWRRGWNDTKPVWTSWVFVVLNIVCCGLLVALIKWYWGIGLFVFAMFCIWVVKTISAPVKQRDECRALLLAEPKQKPESIPLPKRDSLIRAISTLGQTARELIAKQEELKRYRSQPVNVDTLSRKPEIDKNNAYDEYKKATYEFEYQVLIAGISFKKSLESYSSWIDGRVHAIIDERDESRLGEVFTLSSKDFKKELDKIMKCTLSEIEKISQ